MEVHAVRGPTMAADIASYDNVDRQPFACVPWSVAASINPISPPGRLERMKRPCLRRTGNRAFDEISVTAVLRPPLHPLHFVQLAIEELERSYVPRCLC